MDKKLLLGKRIKELRKQRGFTQDYLAEKLNIETRQLSKLETGKNYPSFETVLGLLETFNITFEELVAFEHLNENANFKQKMFDEISELDDEKIRYVYKIVRGLFS